MSAPTPSPSSRTSTPTPARPVHARRTARSTASMLCVIRTAPIGAPASMTGTAVASSVWSSVTDRRSRWSACPRSARAISGRLE
ncbi:hypothetical protein LRS13_09650 [Svornostia abyssi]|uniref:Uncharacterized protein n=1 Tax=Svornostia abyssi TaxID=2898438 RepID=A0ABY5PM83_9ACTN|nr:hypothetical protein LRS13_09650 [Parviterribacteraceae bacterium J379]